MTTDSRTSEMIVAEALTMLPEKIRLHIATRAVKALRAAGPSLPGLSTKEKRR